MEKLVKALEKYETIIIEEFSNKFASGILIYDKETDNLLGEVHTTGTYAFYDNIPDGMFKTVNTLSKELKLSK